MCIVFQSNMWPIAKLNVMVFFLKLFYAITLTFTNIIIVAHTTLLIKILYKLVF